MKCEVSQDFKDALIIYIFQWKSDRAVCDNHRGISLKSIPRKNLAHVILNRLTKPVNDISTLLEG